jgi:ferredoxin-like protein FixX
VYGIGLKELWDVKPRSTSRARHPHRRLAARRRPTAAPSSTTRRTTRSRSASSSGSAIAIPTCPRTRNSSASRRIRRSALPRGRQALAYGARAIAAGGLQSLPKLVFPGGALIGDDAGFLNASRIKGSHAAIKSGMLAAEAAVDALKHGRAGDELAVYPEAFRASWLHEELYKARNFKPWMSKGLYLGTVMFGVDQVLLRGRAPWTLKHAHADHETLKPKNEAQPIQYPKPDGILTFDRLTDLSFSNTNHGEDQPAHLTLKDPSVPVAINLKKYDGPEQRYCPAGVYEFVGDAEKRLQINAQNCVHCKTCDIKDPTQNIVWVAPRARRAELSEHVTLPAARCEKLRPVARLPEPFAAVVAHAGRRHVRHGVEHRLGEGLLVREAELALDLPIALRRVRRNGSARRCRSTASARTSGSSAQRVGLQLVVLEGIGHPCPERIEQIRPSGWDVCLGMDDGHDALATGLPPVPIHASTCVRPGILHRGGEVRERGAVVHAIDHDVLVEVEGAGGVVHEESELAVGAVDGEEERAIAAAVRDNPRPRPRAARPWRPESGRDRARARSAGWGSSRRRCG